MEYLALKSLPYRDYSKHPSGMKDSVTPNIGDTIFIPDDNYAEYLIEQRCITKFTPYEGNTTKLPSVLVLDIEPSVDVSANVKIATRQALVLAKEHGIDISKMTGTGTDGKITKGDVQDMISVE